MTNQDEALNGSTLQGEHPSPLLLTLLTRSVCRWIKLSQQRAGALDLLVTTLPLACR
jgi:hypothetical protein